MKYLGLFPLVALIVVLTGCGDATGKKKLAEVQVSGKVTIDKQPLADGELMLVQDGTYPLIIEIKNGSFSGKAYAGNNRVEIRAYKAGPPMSTDPEKKPTKVNYIPTRYNDQSKTMKDIPAGGATDLVFEVTAR